MESKKICFFISSLSKAAGTERVCSEIANKLAQLGYSVTILCMYAGKPFFRLDKSIETLFIHDGNNKSRLFIPVTLFGLRLKLKKIKPDVLINVDSALYVYSSIASAALPIKNIVWEHFHYKAATYSTARVVSRKLAARFSDAIITLTQADKIQWQKNAVCKASIGTINNPLPVPVAADMSFSDRKQIVLAVGRLNHQKGFDLLLDAWQRVKLNDHENWQLHIVGSGELKSELEDKIQTLDLKKSVRLIPATSAVSSYYKQAGIYCLSSRYEGFPMVLLEALAFGLPIVSFDCETGPAEILSNETSLLVKNSDTNALAASLSFLMQDESKRRKMSANALKHASKYSIDTIIQDWQRLIATI